MCFDCLGKTWPVGNFNDLFIFFFSSVFFLRKLDVQHIILQIPTLFNMIVLNVFLYHYICTEIFGKRRISIAKTSPLLMSKTNDCVRFPMTWSKVFVKFTHPIFIEIDISLKNGNKKLSTVLKIHKMKFKFKANQHGPLKR